MSSASELESGSGTRLAAFVGLTALAAWRYASIEAKPPTARVFAVVALAIVGAALLMLTRPREQASGGARLRAAVSRVLVGGLLLTLALLAIGVPAHLLLPAGWGTFRHGLHRGLGAVATTLWPYAGRNAWTRLDILLAIAVVPLAAAALAFWPAKPGDPSSGAHYRIRRLGALALLLALYVTGVLDSSGGSATLEGLLLLGLIAGWLWMPGLRARRMLAAVAWLAVAGAVAAVVSGSLAGGQAWLHYRAWNLLGAGTQSTAFSWDQTYGPIPWARSQSVMFTVRSRSPQLWKVTTLDRFDGVRFVRSGTEPASEADLPLPLNDRWYEFARFTIEGLRSRLLPIEQGTTAGVTLDRPIDYQTDGTVRTPSPAPGHGASYTVMSYVPQPSPAELRKAPRTFPAAYLHYTDFDLPAPSQSGLHVATTDPLRRGLFFVSGLLTASAVTNAGAIGFVGLIVPHACRFAFGPDHRVLIPAAVLAGGGFLVLCDTLARTVVAPTQLPVGAITAIIGAPVFLYQLHQLRK